MRASFLSTPEGIELLAGVYILLVSVAQDNKRMIGNPRIIAKMRD
jgi:hypothetical protein